MIGQHQPSEPKAKVATAKKRSKTKKAAATKPAPKAKKAVKAVKPEIKLRPDGLRVGSAGGQLVDAICASKGATHKELCQIVKWKSCLPFAMKSVAQAKVKLRKEREPNGEVRYFGRHSR
jgi:hypothetical protein